MNVTLHTFSFIQKREQYTQDKLAKLSKLKNAMGYKKKQEKEKFKIKTTRKC